MEIFNALALVIGIGICIQVNSSPVPGRHVHHRIYIPQKIKTIYHTKIIKVPEHHHYFHEKEKIIQLETPHHKDDYKPYKDHSLKHSYFDHDDGPDDFSDFHSNSHHYHGESHNIFKKHAVTPKHRTRSRVHRKKQREEEEED